MALPIAVYSSAQVRALDQRAIESLPVSGYTLMKRAGEAALRYLRARWPMSTRIVIVCGGGNNGGDGYVLARFAQAAGLEVSVIAAAPVAGLKGDARQAHADFAASGGAVRPLSTSLLREGEVIVDAVFGSNSAWLDFRSVSPQLRSFDARSCSALIPFTGGISGATERTSGKNVIVLKCSVIL